MATKLTIQEQGALRWRKEAEIAVDGIHYRLLRSLLTLGVIVLAVAFLTNILVESRIADACKRGVLDLAVRQRELILLAAFTDAPLDARELAGRIADLPPGAWPLDALADWMGLDGGALARFKDDCRAWRDATAWIEERAPGHRRLLAGKRDTEETFILLADPEGARDFAETARRIPLSLPAGFMDFAARRPAFLAELDAVADRFGVARARLSTALDGIPLVEGLSAAAPAPAAALLAQQGLRIEPRRMESLLQRARERDQERRLLGHLRHPGLPSAWRDRYRQVFEQDRALARLAADEACAAWVLAQTAPANDPSAPLTPATAALSATRLLQARRLADVEDRLLAHYGTAAGLSANMFWLLVVSFLVCMAGITNAMLLSVIERFREIATMKCLGALNGFIARLFLLEAAAMGFVGGLLGFLLGGAIGIARLFLAYGHWVGRFFPWSGLAATAVIATACGLVLATLSALYPAWSAARMPPIEAMRVE